MNEQSTEPARVGTRIVWRFGEVTLDEGTRELSCAGNIVVIEPKPIELLMFLLRRAGEAVTREEILAALWPGRMLTDGAVTNCVAKLREAIDDRDRDIVRTVPRCGYRLVAEVQRDVVASNPPDTGGVGLEPGLEVPLRPAWRLLRSLSTGGATETWLAQRDVSEGERVFRFAADTRGLALLKHEVALSRALNDTLRESSQHAALLDWNFEQPPYFLECQHYPGGNLADWCERQGGLDGVPLRTRIELAARCAQAVAAAHSAGVFHRNLKPANILIDGERHGMPDIRLCDFAAGHLIDPLRYPDLDVDTTGDRDQPPAATAYLAPELLAGQPATALCDIYALGVLLYQLLAGDLRRPLAQGWEQDIEDPLLREDIAFAVAGDPQRRLADAGRLALRLRSLVPRRAELELRQREEVATEDRQQRALRSHGRRDMLVTVLIVVLFAGLGSASLLLRARAAEQLAQAQSEAVATVAQLITRDSDRYADPLNLPEPDPVYAVMLDRTVKALEQRLPDHPLVRARLRQAIGAAYGIRGDIDQAEALLLKAERAYAEELGPASKETQQARIALRDAYRRAGRIEKMGAVSARIVAAEDAAGRPQPGIWYDGAWSLSVANCARAHGAAWLGDCSTGIFALADQAAGELEPSHAAYLNLLWQGGTLAVATDIAVAQAVPRLREGFEIARQGARLNGPLAAGFRVYWAAALCASGAASQGLELLGPAADSAEQATPHQGFETTTQLTRARCQLGLGQAQAASENARLAYERAAGRAQDPLAALNAPEIYARALIAAGRGQEAVAVVDRAQAHPQIERIRTVLESGERP